MKKALVVGGTLVLALALGSWGQDAPGVAFTSVQDVPMVNDGGTAGAAWVDFDGDGDLDLFTVGTSRRGLYRNDTQNTNSWIKLALVGTASNRSAVGAKVMAQATINGQVVWQFREVSTQNSFLGHNSLNVHLGFADAALIETLRIEWPSGAVDEFQNVPVNQFLTATEGAPLEARN